MKPAPGPDPGDGYASGVSENLKNPDGRAGD